MLCHLRMLADEQLGGREGSTGVSDGAAGRRSFGDGLHAPFLLLAGADAQYLVPALANYRL